MCQIRNTNNRYQAQSNQKEEAQMSFTAYDTIQQLYDECDFENCLALINKVLSAAKQNNNNNNQLTNYYGHIYSMNNTIFPFNQRQHNILSSQDEDIIVKKGYCLFRLKKYSCLQSKILNRFSHLPRIQRLQLLYLFETKNFYKVLQILSRNTQNTDHQKMRVDSLFELNRYQECLDALKGFEFHMKRCTRLSYIKAICLKNLGRIDEYLKLAITLIEQERLNSNFIRKLLKGVLNTYMQDSSNLFSLKNYCSLFMRNTSYFKNINKFQKYYTTLDSFIVILKEQKQDTLSSNSEKNGLCQRKINVNCPQKCYICLNEFPLVFSICKNYCEFICISCIQQVSIKCIKCMICKTPYL